MMDGELLSLYPYPSDSGYRNKLCIRYLPTGPKGKPTLWRRVAVLPCVQGQKYTLGNTCTSRERDGEFIWLPNKSQGLGQEKSICEIKVERNKYWVTPTSSIAVVLINDVNVSKKTQLGFGDTLLLADKKNVFLFKERELDPGAFIYSATPSQKLTNGQAAKRLAKIAEPGINEEFAPGQNAYILSHILSYLPVEDVKSSRLVAKLWNEEGFKLLKKECTLFLDFSYQFKNSYESMKLFRYAVEMKDSPMPNWRITIPGSTGIIPYNKLDLSSEPGAKLLEDFNWLLSGDNEKIHCVKQLELGNNIISRPDYQVCQKVLQSLGQNLEELTLFGEWNLGADSPIDLPDTIQFPKLRMLTLNITQHSAKGHFKNRQSFCQRVIKSIQGVKAIRFCQTGLSYTFLKCLSESESLKWFSNLSEITLHFTYPYLINILLKFPTSFKKLELNRLKNMEDQDFEAFEELLSKHAQTLESLQFIIPPSPENGAEELPQASINFPALPKLKSLNIGWIPQLHAHMIFPNGTSSINYVADLPCLESLTLWPVGFGKYPNNADVYPNHSIWPDRAYKDYAKFCGMFFPAITAPDHGEEIATCKTVSNLDILCKKGTRLSSRPIFPEAAEFAIAVMFPNVRNNSWINLIRERSEDEIVSNSTNGNDNPPPELSRPSSSSTGQSTARQLRPRYSRKVGSGRSEGNADSGAKNSRK